MALLSCCTTRVSFFFFLLMFLSRPGLVYCTFSFITITLSRQLVQLEALEALDLLLFERSVLRTWLLGCCLLGPCLGQPRAVFLLS